MALEPELLVWSSDWAVYQPQHLKQGNRSEPHFQALGSGGLATSHRLGEDEVTQADPGPGLLTAEQHRWNSRGTDTGAHVEVGARRCPRAPPTCLRTRPLLPAQPTNVGRTQGVEAGVGMGAGHKVEVFWKPRKPMRTPPVSCARGLRSLVPSLPLEAQPGRVATLSKCKGRGLTKRPDLRCLGSTENMFI